MNNLQPSRLAADTNDFSERSKQRLTKKTLVELLNDQDAMSDWITNIDKIRRFELSKVSERSA